MAVVQPKDDKKKNDVKNEPRVDERLMEPGDYEITSDVTFDVDIYLKKEGSRWMVVDKGMKDAIEHKVVFRMWNYDEMVEMRKMCTSYDSNKRMHMIDNDALNRLKVQKLMVSWTFGNDNPRLKLHRIQGTLTDESWGAFKRLQPNIITTILDKANRVYEFNG